MRFVGGTFSLIALAGGALVVGTELRAEVIARGPIVVGPVESLALQSRIRVVRFAERGVAVNVCRPSQSRQSDDKCHRYR
jgi:hypothetical protein